jgi:SAM-dependent methyltransferase
LARRDLPIPPPELRQPASILPAPEDDHAGYLERGADTRRAIESVLPESWTWSGARVLDFGCGSGRVLRHFLDEARDGDFWGAEIDARSIQWNTEHLDPPMRFVVNGEAPPLPFADASFDLVYAMSVFTHITELWADWLLELHRILDRGGLLIATFMGEGMAQAVAGERWDDGLVGMNVHQPGQSWDLGGPMVLHSPWWVTAHWGRLFQIDRVVPHGFVRHVAGDQVQDHGAAVLRKTDRTATRSDLEQLEPGEPREATALAHEVRRLRSEAAALRVDRDARAATHQPE